MRTKLTDPSDATLLKRQQREAKKNGTEKPKGRVKQCILTNDALKKDEPKTELQKLLREKKISVAGLKRCYYDFRIDETALILLGIPFRRKKELKGKAPRATKDEAPRGTKGGGGGGTKGGGGGGEPPKPKLIQRVSEPLDGADLAGIKKNQQTNFTELEKLAKKTVTDKEDILDQIAKAREVAFKVFQEKKDKKGFQARHVFHQHDNVGKTTKDEAEISNTEAKIKQELLRKKKEVEKQEKELLVKQYTTLEQDERDRQKEIDDQLLSIARTIDLLDPRNATASRIDEQLNANRKVIDDLRQTGLPTRPTGFVLQSGYNQAPVLKPRTIDETMKEQKLATQLSNYSAFGERSRVFERQISTILSPTEDSGMISDVTPEVVESEYSDTDEEDPIKSLSQTTTQSIPKRSVF